MAPSHRVLALLFVLGCSGQEQPPEPAPAPTPAPAAPKPVTLPAPEPTPVASAEALEALRSEARTKLRARDFAGAAATYEKACVAGDPGACVALADMLDSGRGVPEDPDRARLLYQQGCAGGLQGACDQLGH
jgi:localization factor PodJL